MRIAIYTKRWMAVMAAATLFTPILTPALAQIDSGGVMNPYGASTANTTQPNLLAQPTLSPGTIFLFNLEAKFAADVAVGGGKAFASWFAEDGITLANGKAPVVGREAIAAQAVWDPKLYQLTWTPQGGQLSGDMGFTYGHYEGRSKDAQGNAVVITGRYFTVWKKQATGDWKVELDASQDEPDDCCSLNKP